MPPPSCACPACNCDHHHHRHRHHHHHRHHDHHTAIVITVRSVHGCRKDIGEYTKRPRPHRDEGQAKAAGTPREASTSLHGKTRGCVSVLAPRPYRSHTKARGVAKKRSWGYDHRYIHTAAVLGATIKPRRSKTSTRQALYTLRAPRRGSQGANRLVRQAGRKVRATPRRGGKARVLRCFFAS